MAKQTIEMNVVKQVLIRLSQGESSRLVAWMLHISRNTVKRYKRLPDVDPMSFREFSAT